MHVNYVHCELKVIIYFETFESYCMPDVEEGRTLAIQGSPRLNASTRTLPGTRQWQ